MKFLYKDYVLNHYAGKSSISFCYTGTYNKTMHKTLPAVGSFSALLSRKVCRLVKFGCPS
jgi:hypothetical protein